MKTKAVGIVLLGHPFLADCVLAQHMFCNVSTKMAIDRGMHPPPSWVGKGGQYIYISIHNKFLDTPGNVLHIELPPDAFTLSKEVSLHSITSDASSLCIILFLLKNSANLLTDTIRNKKWHSLFWHIADLWVVEN
jgi:hypothetical protein